MALFFLEAPAPGLQDAPAFSHGFSTADIEAFRSNAAAAAAAAAAPTNSASSSSSYHGNGIGSMAAAAASGGGAREVCVLERRSTDAPGGLGAASSAMEEDVEEEGDGDVERASAECVWGRLPMCAAATATAAAPRGMLAGKSSMEGLVASSDSLGRLPAAAPERLLLLPQQPIAPPMAWGAGQSPIQQRRRARFTPIRWAAP